MSQVVFRNIRTTFLFSEANPSIKHRATHVVTLNEYLSIWLGNKQPSQEKYHVLMQKFHKAAIANSRAPPLKLYTLVCKPKSSVAGGQKQLTQDLKYLDTTHISAVGTLSFFLSASDPSTKPFGPYPEHLASSSFSEDCPHITIHK